MIDQAFGADEQCAVCKCGVEDCICPECPTCHEAGNPKCYAPDEGHQALRLSKAQLMSRSKVKIAELTERIQDEEQYQVFLIEQADTYSEPAPKNME